jgi:DNA-directed RNA polymerase specialized sigma24 family protein
MASMSENTWWSRISDPLQRYERAGREQQAAEALVTRMTDLRARCLADLHAGGQSLTQIAKATGLSRARVQQLVSRGANVVAPPSRPDVYSRIGLRRQR